MEGYISPVSSCDEEDEAEIAAILQEELQFDEVDINIHFHCEHCVKLKCKVWPKPGWSCEIISCPRNCGMRFHTCKLEEHDLMCSEVRVPCLNAGYGCPHTLPRCHMSRHLPRCPASVVVCGCERNRWIVTNRFRETTAPHRRHMMHFNPNDLDVSLALHDQALLNQLSMLGAEEASAATSATNRRFPVLPLHSPLTGGPRNLFHFKENNNRSKRSPSLVTDEEDLVPGLSGSVCAKLRRPSYSSGKLQHDASSTGVRSSLGEQGTSTLDEYFLQQCTHGVHQNMCRMCKHDAPLPMVQLKSVWREEWESNSDGLLEAHWCKQTRVNKVRRRGPLDTVMFYKVEDSDDELMAILAGDLDGNTVPAAAADSSEKRFSNLYAALTPAELRVELSFENYSKHQTKPRNMLTIQCLQVLRRDEFPSHYEAVHCALLGEGLEGRQLLRRCPLQSSGCPYSLLCMTAGTQNGEISFSPEMQAFGLKPHLDYEPPLPSDSSVSVQAAATGSSLILPTPLTESPLSPCPSLRPSPTPGSRGTSPAPILYQAAPLLTCLPQELLQYILSYLDGFSLCQVAQSCEVLALACAGLVRDRGLVLMYWRKEEATQQQQDQQAATTSYKQNKTRWVMGKPRWVFSSSFGSIDTWRVKEGIPSMADHLKTCPYYHRNVTGEKFSYGRVPPRSSVLPLLHLLTS
uniref:F-box only protein 30-like n=1 Tax=Hirondellea gigas TaxID=1518452 RepID=A0A2P2I3M8_9CRUS